jgi:UDP-glucose 4-epimerase
LAVNDVLNLGSDNEMTILELANRIIQLTGSSSKLKHFPPLPEGDMSRRKPDISRMRNILNRELTSLEEGVEKTAAFIKSNYL